MEDNKCSSCDVVLDRIRDGTTENGHRCHNCYWEEEGKYMRKKDVPRRSSAEKVSVTVSICWQRCWMGLLTRGRPPPSYPPVCQWRSRGAR